jgi:hypothetical protein
MGDMIRSYFDQNVVFRFEPRRLKRGQFSNSEALLGRSRLSHRLDGVASSIVLSAGTHPDEFGGVMAELLGDSVGASLRRLVRTLLGSFLEASLGDTVLGSGMMNS